MRYDPPQFLKLASAQHSVTTEYWISHSHSEHLAPVLFLHGVGCCKEDFADACFQPEFADRTLIAWDAPGCGCSVNGKRDISIALMADACLEMLSALGLRPVHAVGHSLGAAVAQRAFEQSPGAFVSLASIEGNLMPEDCQFSMAFESRRAATSRYLKEFGDRLKRTAQPGFAQYGARFASNLDHRSASQIMGSLVQFSKGGALQRFIDAALPRLYVYGECGSPPSYLSKLLRADVEIKTVPGSSHFPMYSNPAHLWRIISDFINRAESGDPARAAQRDPSGKITNSGRERAA